MNELPFPPKIHGTVELEEKIKGKAGFKGGDVIKELGWKQNKENANEFGIIYPIVSMQRLTVEATLFSWL